MKTLHSKLGYSIFYPYPPLWMALSFGKKSMDLRKKSERKSNTIHRGGTDKKWNSPLLIYMYVLEVAIVDHKYSATINASLQYYMENSFQLVFPYSPYLLLLFGMESNQVKIFYPSNVKIRREGVLQGFFNLGTVS